MILRFVAWLVPISVSICTLVVYIQDRGCFSSFYPVLNELLLNHLVVDEQSVVACWLWVEIPHWYVTDWPELACENIRFSSLFATGDVSRRGTFATQRQKFHTDDANQCLHNTTGSHGVPNTNLYSFTCLLVDFGKFLCSSANELQQYSNSSSREEYIQQILTVLLEMLRVYIWPLWPFVFCLSFANNS